MSENSDALDEISAIQIIDDYTDAHFQRFYDLIWRGTPIQQPFAENMDAMHAFREERSQERILAAADVLCAAGNLAPIQDALVVAMRSLIQFGNVQLGSPYLQGMKATTGIDEAELETYVECVVVRALEVIGWLLTLNEITVADYRNAEIYRLCHVFCGRQTSPEQKKAASDVLKNYADFLLHSIRWKPMKTKQRSQHRDVEIIPDKELHSLLERSVRLSCEQVSRLCGLSTSTVQERHVRGAGWKHPHEPKALYWYKAWLLANSRLNLEDFLLEEASR